MLHKTLQTKAQTLTDKGEFTAIAAAYSVDRVNDQIIPGAFSKSIERWQSSGQRIPLHWDHSGAAEDIIGTVDPASMKEVELGLVVSGSLDLKGSAVAREAWRSIKNNAVALSFGYMTTQERKRKDGVNELLELDLFEVSVVPAPANPDTKFLSFKSAEAALEEETEKETSAVEDGSDEEPETVKSAPQDPLVQEAWDLVLRKPRPKRLPEPTPEPEPEPLDADEVQREAWSLVLKTSGK